MIVKSWPAYWVIISFLSMLLLMNIGVLFQAGMLITLLPISIQSVVLIFLLLKHRYAKLILQIWVTIFLIASSAMQLLGKWMEQSEEPVESELIRNAVLLLIGIIVLVLTNVAIKTEKSEQVVG